MTLPMTPPMTPPMTSSLPLVPHQPPLLLIDTVEEVDRTHCRALARVDPGAWYADPTGAMPGWFGLELMAQTISAFSGHQHLGDGLPPAYGYLLGTREYACDLPAFPAGALLEVEARLDYFDDFGLSAFVCEIRHEGACCARATLKVYEPKP